MWYKVSSSILHVLTIFTPRQLLVGPDGLQWWYGFFFVGHTEVCQMQVGIVSYLSGRVPGLQSWESGFWIPIMAGSCCEWKPLAIILVQNGNMPHYVVEHWYWLALSRNWWQSKYMVQWIVNWGLESGEPGLIASLGKNFVFCNSLVDVGSQH